MQKTPRHTTKAARYYIHTLVSVTRVSSNAVDPRLTSIDVASLLSKKVIVINRRRREKAIKVAYAAARGEAKVELVMSFTWPADLSYRTSRHGAVLGD